MISKKNEAANAPKKFEEFVMVMIKCGNSMLQQVCPISEVTPAVD